MMIVRYYYLLHKQENVRRKAQGLVLFMTENFFPISFLQDHKDFSNRLWVGLLLELLVCGIHPIPLADLFYDDAWGNRQAYFFGVLGVYSQMSYRPCSGL